MAKGIVFIQKGVQLLRPQVLPVVLFLTILFSANAKFLTYSAEANIIALVGMGLMALILAGRLILLRCISETTYTYNIIFVGILLSLLGWAYFVTPLTQVSFFGFSFQQTTLISITSYFVALLLGYSITRLSNISKNIRNILFAIQLGVATSLFMHIVYILNSLLNTTVLSIDANDLFSFSVLIGLSFILAIYIILSVKTSGFTREVLVFFVIMYGIAILFSGSDVLLVTTGIGGIITVGISYFSKLEKAYFRRYFLITGGITILITVAGAFSVGTWIQNKIPIFPVENNLSLRLTLYTGINATEDITGRYVTGTGANSFSVIWDNYMPSQAYNTRFFDTDISKGSSLMSTLLVEIGYPFVISITILIILLGLGWLSSIRFKMHGLYISLFFGLFWMWFYMLTSLVVLILLLIAGILLGNFKKVSLIERNVHFARISETVVIILFILSGVVLVYNGVLYKHALNIYYEGQKILKNDNKAYVIPHDLFVESLQYAKTPIILEAIARLNIRQVQILNSLDLSKQTAKEKKEIESQKNFLAVEAVSYSQQAKEIDIENYHAHIIYAEALLIKSIVSGKTKKTFLKALYEYKNISTYALKRILPRIVYIRVVNSMGYKYTARTELRMLLKRYPNFGPLLLLKKDLYTQNKSKVNNPSR